MGIYRYGIYVLLQIIKYETYGFMVMTRLQVASNRRINFLIILDELFANVVCF